MIEMIASVFGLPVKQKNGEIRVVAKGPEDGPFTASPEQEARLVEQGLARRVDAPAPVVVDAPIGFNETPDEVEIRPLDEMNANELRELGKEYGLTFRVGMKKADMIAAITAAQAEPVEVDETPDEDAPTFDAAEAVL